jgi:hypothetical protein
MSSFTVDALYERDFAASRTVKGDTLKGMQVISVPCWFSSSSLKGTGSKIRSMRGHNDTADNTWKSEPDHSQLESKTQCSS